MGGLEGGRVKETTKEETTCTYVCLRGEASEKEVVNYL